MSSAQRLPPTPPSGQLPLLHSCLAKLRSARDPVSRHVAGAVLSDYIEGEACDLQGDDANAFFTELHHGVVDMLSSTEMHERAGGVLAVTVLLQADTDEEQGLKLSIYASHLQLALQRSADNAELLNMIYNAFGHLTRSSRDPEVVEREAKRALDCLSSEVCTVLHNHLVHLTSAIHTFSRTKKRHCRPRE